MLRILQNFDFEIISSKKYNDCYQRTCSGWVKVDNHARM